MMIRIRSVIEVDQNSEVSTAPRYSAFRGQYHGHFEGQFKGQLGYSSFGKFSHSSQAAVRSEANAEVFSKHKIKRLRRWYVSIHTMRANTFRHAWREISMVTQEDTSSVSTVKAFNPRRFDSSNQRMTQRSMQGLLRLRSSSAMHISQCSQTTHGALKC